MICRVSFPLAKQPASCSVGLTSGLFENPTRPRKMAGNSLGAQENLPQDTREMEAIRP